MFDSNHNISIDSHKGKYEVVFVQDISQILNNFISNEYYFIVDQNIKNLYSNKYSKAIEEKINAGLCIQANEYSKSLEQISFFAQDLIDKKIRRGVKLVAIGGGIVQDICCFLASIYLRGMDWIFIPTTLLSQADSCIGSKSSINLGITKNIIGTFYPPKKVFISNEFLNTLSEEEIRSGIGEIIKIYGICGYSEINDLTNSFEIMLKDKIALNKFIYKSLTFKKKIIEEDEFDNGTRLVLNYGHSFGHAIESASKYEIPHGIAVSMGCHFANFVANKLDINDGTMYKTMGKVLINNFKIHMGKKFNFEAFIESLKKDKKNVLSQLTLVLPDDKNNIRLFKINNDEKFLEIYRDFLRSELKFEI